METLWLKNFKAKYLYATLNQPDGGQHDDNSLRRSHSELVSESQAHVEVRKAVLESVNNGVTRGNRFGRVTEGNSFDNHQNSISRWAKSVTPFKDLKTNKLNENDKKTTHVIY